MATENRIESEPKKGAEASPKHLYAGRPAHTQTHSRLDKQNTNKMAEQ